MREGADSGWTGRRLGGRYTLGQRLGSGGMGSVFAATQDDLRRPVAIKVLHPHLAERPDLLERFKREAMAAAALGHPNVVQVTDFCQPPGEPPFLVMEQLSGETLRDSIDREGPLPPGRVAFIAAQVLSALETTHAAGIVHRDLKPENVFLTSITGVRDIVKVLDFGLAKHGASGGPALTETGQVMGTPAYMAPEQVAGQPVTPSTDLYALGAVMYVALTGRLPYAGDNNYALMYAIAQGARAPITSLRGDLPPGLAAAIERAMAVDPAQRFASATQMRHAIEPFAQGQAPLASVVRTPAVPLAMPPTPPSGFGAMHPTPGSPGAAPTLPGSIPPTATPDFAPTPSVSPGASSIQRGQPPSSAALTITVVIVVGVVLVAALGLGAILIARNHTPVPSPAAVVREPVDPPRPTASAPVTEVATPIPKAAPAPPEPAPAPTPTPAPETDDESDTPGLLTRLGLRGDDEAVPPVEPVEPVEPDVPDEDDKPKKKKKKVVPRVPTGGTKPRLAFINANSLLDLKVVKPELATIQDAVTDCYVAHEFSPGDHVHSSYHLFIDGEGKTTKATTMGNRERSPDLDACLFPLFRRLEFGPPKIEGGGKIDITYTAWIPGQ